MDINLYLHNVDRNSEEASRIATNAAKRILSWIPVFKAFELTGATQGSRIDS